MNYNEEVLLISLPWTTVLEPSLGLSILKSSLDDVGVSSKVVNLNLKLLNYLKHETYELLSETYVLNEFLFSGVLDNFQIDEKQNLELRHKIEEYRKQKKFVDFSPNSNEDIFNLIVHLRNTTIPNYLNDCADEILKHTNTKLYCFTCMFDQTIASLSLASMIKAKIPNSTIVFGGYALAGDVAWEIIKSFNFIDIVCSGEGEETIVELATIEKTKKSLSQVPNIIFRNKENNIVSSFLRKVNLSNSPTPNFKDFVNDISTLKVNDNIEISWNSIPLENSRGCWWGEKNHCVFCGIDDDTMKYRVKPFEKALKDIELTTETYSIKNIRFSDYILPFTYYKTLIPELIKNQKHNPLRIACELKANLTYSQMQDLKNAGFVDVQPGIESFSSSVLKKINKGVTGIQNIYTLLLGKIFDVNINYNIIYGFPNDEAKDYKELIDLIPKLYHLHPPYSVVPVSITRFAPLHTEPEKYGYNRSDIRYDKMYDMLFTTSFLEEHKFDLNNYCYYFERPFENSDELKEFYEIIKFQTAYWNNETVKRKIILNYHYSDIEIHFSDQRLNSITKEYSFGKKHLEFYRYYYGKIGFINKIEEDLIGFVNDLDIQQILADFIDKDIIYIEGNKFILLALLSTDEALHPRLNSAQVGQTE